MLFPFTDLSGAKLRPAIVLASEAPHDVIVAFVTSREVVAGDSETAVLLDPDDEEFRITGLDRRSTIRLARIATLSPALVRRKLGELGPATTERVEAGLRAVFGI
ncbi:MAG: type II toxin-antitoxin system PemK/MazF family toxin [Dehalococcoidia bacterium]|nr:type II toxin-antitoxin system PemK/MazF family toxin [Dehalococcoidia bacterium]